MEALVAALLPAGWSTRSSFGTALAQAFKGLQGELGLSASHTAARVEHVARTVTSCSLSPSSPHSTASTTRYHLPRGLARSTCVDKRIEVAFYVRVGRQAAEYAKSDLAPVAGAKLTDAVMLQLYALFKQASIGPCETKKPSLFEGFAARAKW